MLEETSQPQGQGGMAQDLEEGDRGGQQLPRGAGGSRSTVNGKGITLWLAERHLSRFSRLLRASEVIAIM